MSPQAYPVATSCAKCGYKSVRDTCPACKRPRSYVRQPQLGAGCLVMTRWGQATVKAVFPASRFHCAMLVVNYETGARRRVINADQAERVH